MKTLTELRMSEVNLKQPAPEINTRGNSLRG